jgi:branched-chain amino acid transport system substrate-binding protein
MPKNATFAACALVALGLATLSACQNASQSEPYVIGAILPLTGTAAQWGIPPRNGAQLAVEEINASGGINGRKIALKVEDDRCEPRDGVSALNKLMAADHAKVFVGAVCSGVTLAIAPVAERSRVPIISPASTSPKITDAGDFIFRVVPSDNLRGEVFADYVFQDRGIHSVALLYVNNEGGVGNKDTFRQRFAELGGQIVAEEAYAQDATDVRGQLTRIRGTNAGAVLVVSYPADTVIVLRQAKELGFTKPLFFQTEAVGDPNVLREAGAAAEGVIFVLPAQAEGKVTQQFNDRYRQKYGKAPELFAAEGYDAVRLIAEALSKRPAGGDRDPALAVRDYLYTVKGWAGASGTISFDRNGDVTKPMAIKQISGGTARLIKTIGSVT